MYYRVYNIQCHIYNIQNLIDIQSFRGRIFQELKYKVAIKGIINSYFAFYIVPLIVSILAPLFLTNN